MRAHFLSLGAIALSCLDHCHAVGNEGTVIKQLHLAIWTDVNAKGSTTVSTHWDADARQDQNAGTYEERKTLDGKNKEFEKVGEVTFFGNDEFKDPRWFRVVLDTGSDDERITICHVSIDEIIEAKTVSWYVGEDDNKLINKQEGMEVVCDLTNFFE